MRPRSVEGDAGRLPMLEKTLIMRTVCRVTFNITSTYTLPSNAQIYLGQGSPHTRDLISFYFYLFITFADLFMCVMHGMCVEVRGQSMGVVFLFLPVGFGRIHLRPSGLLQVPKPI